MSRRKSYSSKQKVKLVLEALSYPDGLSAFCRKHGITENMFYRWKDKLLSNADSVFLSNKKNVNKISKLKEIIANKDAIISEIVEENLNLKKNFSL